LDHLRALLDNWLEKNQLKRIEGADADLAQKKLCMRSEQRFVATDDADYPIDVDTFSTDVLVTANRNDSVTATSLQVSWTRSRNLRGAL
jgi:hypothetical protein